MARKIHKIEDSNVTGYSRLMPPDELKAAVPLTSETRRTVEEGRSAIRNIINGRDRRLLLVVGPCSIHDVDAAKDYAAMLNGLRKRVADKFVIVERTYFEKPRTTVGWKGLINEPRLNGEERINEGLLLARKVLAHNASIGLPSATEFLDPFTPQWIGDLVSWAAIGARTVESSTHRQMASGLSMPIGFKNGTSGGVQVAIDAVIAARQPQWFFGLDPSGRPSAVSSAGNQYTHIILRGGSNGPNYDEDSVKAAQLMLRKHRLQQKVMIDCSHGNSGKDYNVQPDVFSEVIRQVVAGNRDIMGLMLESNIHEGRQDIPDDPALLHSLKYGVSVTDACIGWEMTEHVVIDAYKKLQRN